MFSKRRVCFIIIPHYYRDYENFRVYVLCTNACLIPDLDYTKASKYL